MNSSERGPMTAYEITWRNGHVETIWAHQVSWPGASRDLFAPLFGGTQTDTQYEPKVQFMGEINGEWVLILSAWESDIRTIRNKVTESFMDGAS